MTRPGTGIVPPAMSSTEPAQQPPEGDPWAAFGYLVAGVLFYGAVGWLADWWLGTSFLVVLGILFGAGLGIYMTYRRLGGSPTGTDKQN